MRLKKLEGKTRASSDSVCPFFASPNAHSFFDVEYKNLAVTDSPGARGLQNRFHRGLDLLGHQHDLNFHLGQKVDDIFGAAVKLGMALLPSEPLSLGYGNPLDADLVQRLFHLV